MEPANFKDVTLKALSKVLKIDLFGPRKLKKLFMGSAIVSSLNTNCLELATQCQMYGAYVNEINEEIAGLKEGELNTS